MKKTQFFCLWMALMLCSTSWADKITETLESPSGDRVTITYDLSIENDMAVLSFISASKVLGPAHARKYDKLEDVTVVFFDHVGVYSDGTVFKDADIRAFSVPVGLRCKSKMFGYYNVKQQPTLTFELMGDEGATLTIPIYLVHYVRKLHYKVFASCGELKIEIVPPASKVNEINDVVPQTILGTVEIEEEAESLSDTDGIALNRANNIVSLLERQKEYPFEEYLTDEIKSLRSQRSEVKDDNVITRIDEVLSQYDSKERMMKAEYEKRLQQQQQAALDSIKKEQERETQAAEAKEEEQKKRNVWMLIGGALLAVLLFVGSQVMQTIRNRRTQRSMLQMQQDAARQAEGMVKRKAQSAIKSKTSQAMNTAKQKGRNAIKTSIDKNKKNNGNKRFSI